MHILKFKNYEDFFKKSDLNYYIFCFLVFLFLYYLVLKFIFPGYFYPLIPHHSDMLDYPYDIKSISGGTLFLRGSRPVGLLLTGIFGIFGYKGVIISGILFSIGSLLIIIKIYEIEMSLKPSLFAIITYGLALFSNSGFYLNYSYDIYDTYALFLALTSILMFYYIENKNYSITMYILISIGILSSFMCKETYPISLGTFFLYKAIFSKNKESRGSAIKILMATLLAFVIVMIQSSYAGSAFVSFAKNSSDAYHTSFELPKILEIFQYYLRGFANFPLILIMVISLLGLYINNKCEIGKYAIWIFCGITAYIPYSLLPNHVIPHYYYVGAPMGYSVLLLLNYPNCKMNNNRKFIFNTVLTLITTVLLTFSIIENSQDNYNLSKWWLGNESAMKRTIDSIDEINSSVYDGDKILVVGLENTVETIFRSLWYIDNKIDKDVFFSVITSEPAFTGKFGNKSEYLIESNTIKSEYDVIINYAGNKFSLNRMS